MEGTDNPAYEDVTRTQVPNNEKSDKADDSKEVVIEDVGLKKQVGLISGIAIIIGTQIGSGIFISPKGVLRGTGSVAASLLVWAGCGVISLCGALTYAELGTMIPKSGGEYAYLYEGISPTVAYLFAWVMVMVLKGSSFAIISLSFAEYVSEPFFDECGPPEIAKKCIACVAIFTITIVNCYSTRLAARVQVIFTALKLTALVIIIIGGLVMLGQGYTVYLSEGFKDTNPDPSIIALAFYNGLWAYDGWNNLNFITEELINPYVNLPRSILIGLPLVTILYLLTNISYLTVMSKEEILASSAVALTWGERVLGPVSAAIPIAVACSTFGAGNGSCFSAGRISFVAAREGHLPGFLSYIHVHKYTPVMALLLNKRYDQTSVNPTYVRFAGNQIIVVLMILALCFMIPGDISTLIDFFSFTAWLFYGATTASLLILRYRWKDAERPYKVPIVIPIFVLLASIYLVIAPIVQDPQIQFLYAALFVIGGLVFYVPFVYFKVRFRFVESFSMGIQLFFEVAPAKQD